VIDIAHRHGVPVIVDAALELPPASNLRHAIALGADLVAFSGGKAIRGPQASGFLCGRADLIQAVAFHHQDMDVRPQNWTYRGLMAAGQVIGPPHHGIGRAMKVGKEEIVGLVVALQRFAQRDEQAEQARWRAMMTHIAERVRGIRGVDARVQDPRSEPTPVPQVSIALDAELLGMSAYQVLNQLQDGEPGVFLNEERAWEDVLVINPIALREGDERIVAQRLAEVLTGALPANPRSAAREVMIEGA
jgi:D-glucosaminate-6-phosphate ammonia-lyase